MRERSEGVGTRSRVAYLRGASDPLGRGTYEENQ